MEIPSADGSLWRLEASALSPGQTAKFRLLHRGKPVEAFIVNVNGGYHAYINRCPHAGTPLDLWPNEFLTEDGRYLICSTHGAVFEQQTGLCVEGPCPGARLEILPVERHDASLVVRCPS